MSSLVHPMLRAFQVQMMIRMAEPVALVNVIVFPLAVSAVSFYALGSGHGDTRTIYAIIGGGLIGFWSITLINANSDLNGERANGTLELLMACPTPLAAVVVGKLLSTMLLGVAGFAPLALFAYAAGGRMPSVQPLEFGVSLLVTIFGFFALGMLLAPLYTASRWVFPLVNGHQLFVYILCGCMFPVSQLPWWAQDLSALLAPSWGVRALYAAAGQLQGQDYAQCWLTGIGVAAIYLVLSVSLFRWVDHRARVSPQMSMA